MSHSFNKIWIHVIWSTKYRLPMITPEIEKILFPFITKQLNDLGCRVKAINGVADHIHCLFMLNPQKPLTEVIKQIKGSSTHFINQRGLMYDRFDWQTGYASFSVSESIVERVFKYICNQKIHHQKLTSEEEFYKFLKLNKRTN